MPEHKRGKKTRKYGRNRVKCARYAAEHRRTRNNPARTKRPSERTPGRGRNPVRAAEAPSSRKR